MEIVFTLLTFTLFSFLGLFFILSFLLLVSLYARKSIGDPKYAPVKGTVFHQLLYFSTLFHHQMEVARTLPTFRLLGPGGCELYTTDTGNVEHILKNQFNKYNKGEHDLDLLVDLFGGGIFVINGEMGT